MSAKPMTKKEWNEYLAKTWEEAVESTYQDMIDAAVKAEREACAKVIPTNWLDPLLETIGMPPWNCLDIEKLLRDIAAAIRARGQV